MGSGSTRVTTSVAPTPEYVGERKTVTGRVIESEATVTLFGRERRAELYSITHPGGGSEVTQEVLVIPDNNDDNVAYLYQPDPHELVAGIRVSHRPPYTILYQGRRWVPAGLLDVMGIWDITGDERDYSNVAFSLLESYWMLQGTPEPTTQEDRVAEAHAGLEALVAVEGATPEARVALGPIVEVLGADYTRGWLQAKGEPELAQLVR